MILHQQFCYNYFRRSLVSSLFFLLFVVKIVPFTEATEYLLLIMATNDEQGFAKEVGECTADRANFGRIIFNGNEAISGCFVSANPPDACTPLTPAPTPITTNQSMTTMQCIGGYYAVASRGNCSFAQKAYHAQSADYRGLIVYNNVGYNYPIQMSPDTEYGPSVDNLYVFMVGYDCGLTIVRAFTYEKGFGFLIRIYWSYNDLLRYLIPFVVVVGICFCVMLTAMLVKCVGDRRREMRRRLTKRHLKQLPTKKFVKGEDPETCPICLDDFEDEEKLRILPCGHAYHCRCVDPWLLKTRRVCPICKRKVLPGPDDSDSDSENDAAAAARRTTAPGTGGGGGGGGSSGTTERTPLLGGASAGSGSGGSSQNRDRFVAGNTIFYGLYDRSTGSTPPLNEGRPVILSPASTPDDDEVENGGGGRPMITAAAINGSGEHSNQHNQQYVNPNFVEDGLLLTNNNNHYQQQ